MKILLVLFSFCFPGIATTVGSDDHDIHVSVCDIVYKEDKGTLEMSVKVFYDDLLNAVGLQPGEELPVSYTSADELIDDFINQNIKIKINGEEKILDYLESHSYPPAVWTTFNIVQVSPIESISMENTILINVFDDQVNMVNIRMGKEKKAFALDVKNNLLDYRK